MQNLSPKLQNMVAQYQELTQRIQAFASQRYAFEVQAKELERAIEELEKASEGANIYRSVGALLIQSRDKPALLAELKEQKETLEVRAKSFDKQEKQLRERHTSLQKQISEELGGAPIGEEDSSPQAG